MHPETADARGSARRAGSVALRYGSALLATALVCALKLLFEWTLGSGVPFLLFFGSVTAISVYAGAGPAMLATALGGGAAWYLFLPPRLGFGFEPRTLVQLLVYLVESAAIITLGEHLRRARVRAEREARRAGREQQERLASEQQMRLMSAAAPDYASCTLDAEGCILSWDQDSERLHGFSPSEVIGRHVSLLYPREAVLSQQPQHALASARQRDRHVETAPRVKRDGSSFWAEITLSPLRGEHGELRGFAQITRDLSERVQAEESRRDVQRRIAAIFAQMVVGIVETDLTGRMLLANRKFCEMVNRPLEELTSLRMQEITHPDDLPENLRLFERLLHEGSSFVLEKRYLRPDGSFVWVHNSVSVVRDTSGNPRHVVAIAQDISERKRAEEARRESEQTFRSFFSSAAVGMCMLDASTRRFLECNAQMQKLTGYTQQELEQLTPLALTHPDDRGEHEQALEAMLRGERAEYVGEKRYLRKDGQLIWVLVTATAVRDAAGKLLRTVGVVEDITAMKRSEQQLRDAVTARDEFLEIVSHELKTPLTPLKLQLDSVLKRLSGDDASDPRLRHKLELAHRQTVRLTRLVESAVDLSSITAGRVTLTREVFDLAELLSDVVSRFRGEALQVGSQITLHEDESVVGFWDRGRLRQIIESLLANAIKYGRGGPIDITLRGAESAVELSVEDHGLGIESDAASRIFERFERAVSVRHFGGLGLGLFIARTYAEAHGGTIRLKSTPGSGSTFTVVLPRDQLREQRAS